MKKKILFYSVAFLLAGHLSMGQATQPPAPIACNANNCTAPLSETCVGGSTVITNFNGHTLRSGSPTSLPAVYTFYNIATVSGNQINATITIDAQSNCNMSNTTFNIDDNTALDQSNNSIASFFAPRITASGNLSTADQRGWVQFTIRFFVENATPGEQYGVSNDDYSTIPPFGGLAGLNYIHYDIDGSTQGTNGWFRETGVVENVAGSTINGNVPTELAAYSYTDGVNWKGFAGSVCERTGVSRCSQVAVAANYSTPQTKITFRMGYDYNYTTSTYGTPPTRQYGSRFGCFTFPQQSTLPVKLMSFNGAYRNNTTYLNWVVTNQVNFSAYEIERSLNGIEFASIGVKQKQGTGLETQQYSFPDDVSAVNSDVFFYRLKMIDIDGKFSYSNVVMVHKNAKMVSGITISPNPIKNTDVATARISASSAAKVDFSILDISGRVVLRQQNQVSQGVNSISINNLNHLQPGTYLLKMNNGETVETIKFSIIR